MTTIGAEVTVGGKTITTIATTMMTKAMMGI
jgi:hypothetical protein